MILCILAYAIECRPLLPGLSHLGLALLCTASAVDPSARTSAPPV